MFLTLPFMAAIQIISACIGWETRRGLARNIAQHAAARRCSIRWSRLLVVANTINIAADLAAMGEALRLVIGGSALIFARAVRRRLPRRRGRSFRITATPAI